MAETHHVVEIGGDTYRLRYQIQFLREAKKITGQTVGQLLGSLLNLDVEAMAILLWVGLRPTRHEFKLKDGDELLQKWIDEGTDLEGVSTALMSTAQVSGLMRKEKSAEADDEETGENGADPKGA